MKATDHVPQNDLTALALGELPFEKETRLRRHVSSCDRCTALLREYSATVKGIKALGQSLPVSVSPALERRLQQLVDSQIEYDVVDLGAMGQVLFAVSERGLCYLAFVEDSLEAAEQRLARAFPGRPLRQRSEKTAAIREDLRRYTRGDLRRFHVPVDLSAVRSAFHRRVLEVTAEIPYGQTVTYGWLAEKIGRPKAARAVGGALNRNPVCIVVPCHRVLANDGALRGYRWGIWRKQRLLQLEGVPVGRGGAAGS